MLTEMFSVFVGFWLQEEFQRGKVFFGAMFCDWQGSLLWFGQESWRC